MFVGRNTNIALLGTGLRHWSDGKPVSRHPRNRGGPSSQRHPGVHLNPSLFPMPCLAFMSLVPVDVVESRFRGTWGGGAQSVKRPTIDLSSGHDLAVHEMTAWSLLGILSLPLSLCPSSAHARSQNEWTNFKNKKKGLRFSFSQEESKCKYDPVVSSAVSRWLRRDWAQSLKCRRLSSPPSLIEVFLEYCILPEHSL